MDDIMKNIEKKVAVDNIIVTEHAKEPTARVNLNRDEDVHRTLVKVDPNDIIDREEIRSRLDEVQERSKIPLNEPNIDPPAKSSRVVDTAKSAFGIFRKPTPEATVEEEQYPFATDGINQDSHHNIGSVEDVSKVQVKSWSNLEELMGKCKKILDKAKFLPDEIDFTRKGILTEKSIPEEQRKDEPTEQGETYSVVEPLECVSRYVRYGCQMSSKKQSC